ncbi:IGF-like family receptor 1 isoform X2 [Coregonus clupeaformis]|uniref:IGF-like family receptor 1 isoform X2 n=1 Tax=Coregonus clupeaformis TaxID=59861 RepID=UPI001BE0BD5E|nr:IGF-like family receptor 1 isoform X2 [Coregonus clupeaformis]
MLTSHQFQTQQVQRSTTLRVQVSTSNPTTAKHIDLRLPGDSHVNHQTAYKENTLCFKVSLKDCLPSDNILYTNQQSRSSKRAEVSLLQSETRSLEDLLSPDLQWAPLQMVLDNLDVLEELVILLDPESPGVKNTSHLASRCSFPSTWITYTYSLRDSKSPLRAVLEGVTTKHPEWTVGHLARHLREMDRNDAVAVLTKLTFLKVV